MKPNYFSLNLLLKGLKAIFFHPMFYAALLLHWAIIQSPLPPKQIEETELEEPVPESIPIASSGSLNSLNSRPKPKPTPDKKKKESPKEEESPKPKPNPLAQALAKEDSKQNAKAEEKRKETLQEQKEEEKKEPEEEKAIKEDNQEKQKEEEGKEQEEMKKEPEEEPEESEKYQGTGEAGAVGFNLRLLPQPDLVFTPESIQNYNDQIGELEYQTNVEIAEWMTQTTSIDDAIQGVKEKPEYSTYSFDKVLSDADHPFSTLYQLTQDGKDTIYISFIKSKKRTLRSSTVFVRWIENPIES